MSELGDAGRMLELAEQAALKNDLAFADELLRGAARIQEIELGPLHPDLANTVNNLAVVAEKTGRLDDAEKLYRRAVAIASASLPMDDPMIAASRQNLEDFCRAHGFPRETRPMIAPLVSDGAAGLDAFHREPATLPAETPAFVAAAADASFPLEAALPPSGSPVSRPRPPLASVPLPPAPRPASRPLAWTAAGAVIVVLLIAAFLMRRPSTPEPSTAEPTMAPPAVATTPPQTAEPQSAVPPPPQARVEPPARPAPVEAPKPPAVVPQSTRSGAAAARPPVSSAAAGSVSLAAAQLCRTLSTSGANWRCDPPADPVPRGRLILYSRVRSPRNGAVVHRWFRGATLRQSVKLPIRASATEGYRTYSRQTVDAGADWRVEVTSAQGDVLFERRFTVR
ncbi:MAG: DUF2914 domain-containing protein [Acidobacteriota bacterium]